MESKNTEVGFSYTYSAKEQEEIKKIRENVKFFGKNKASLPLNDIEIAIKFLEETEKLYFSIHCNSANDLFFKPEESPKEFEQSHKQRRLKSQKSMNLHENPLCSLVLAGLCKKILTARRNMPQSKNAPRTLDNKVETKLAITVSIIISFLCLVFLRAFALFRHRRGGKRKPPPMHHVRRLREPGKIHRRR